MYGKNEFAEKSKKDETIDKRQTKRNRGRQVFIYTPAMHI